MRQGGVEASSRLAYILQVRYYCAGRLTRCFVRRRVERLHQARLQVSRTQADRLARPLGGVLTKGDE